MLPPPNARTNYNLTHPNSLKRVLLILIVAHMLSTILLIRHALQALNNESEKLAKYNDIEYRPSDYHFDRLALSLYLLVQLLVLGAGLIGVYLLRHCLILFYATTGSGLYMLLLLVLYGDQLLGGTITWLLGFACLGTSALAILFYFKLQTVHHYTLSI